MRQGASLPIVSTEHSINNPLSPQCGLSGRRTGANTSELLNHRGNQGLLEMKRVFNRKLSKIALTGEDGDGTFTESRKGHGTFVANYLNLIHSPVSSKIPDARSKDAILKDPRRGNGVLCRIGMLL